MNLRICLGLIYLGLGLVDGLGLVYGLGLVDGLGLVHDREKVIIYLLKH